MKGIVHSAIEQWDREFGASCPDAARRQVLEAPTRLAVYARVLHELIHPDNGYCNQCGGHWLYRADGTWEYAEGEHTSDCVFRREVEIDAARRASRVETTTLDAQGELADAKLLREIARNLPSGFEHRDWTIARLHAMALRAEFRSEATAESSSESIGEPSEPVTDAATDFRELGRRNGEALQTLWRESDEAERDRLLEILAPLGIKRDDFVNQRSGQVEEKTPRGSHRESQWD